MMTASSLSLDQWADNQLRISALKMAECVSATSLRKERAAFGQTVRPAKGSVLAATGSAASPSEPDYFFHWLRDSAVVMDAALALIRCGIDVEFWRQHFVDFVRFSLGLYGISGRRFLQENDLESCTTPQARQYLRPEQEIAAVEEANIAGEVRYNADGTLDFLRWSRPQHDGPAMRALVALRFTEAQAVPDEIRDDLAELIRRDLDYTADHAAEPCFDIWEEEIGLHYYTCLVQFAALQTGARWTSAQGASDEAARFCLAARQIEAKLDDFWSSPKNIYLSRIIPSGPASTKEPDFSVILGILHAGLRSGRHSIKHLRAARTFLHLEETFAVAYVINRDAGPGVAFGRYPGDRYVSGGAWFVCTFGAAELCYKLALSKADVGLIAKGDAIFGMARQFIPPSGEISEQFDQKTGEQTSVKSLAWSYAAFITAWVARNAAQAICKE
jgi:glucoamylase